MKWFGTTWHAPICEPKERVKIPVGERCWLCNTTFLRYSRGVMLDDKPVHVACMHRWIAPQ